MAAMDKMLADMLKRIIPPEVMDLLTPEKVKEVTEGINAYILYQREFMDRTDSVLKELAIVPEKNKASFEKLFAIMADMQQQIEELKDNARRKSSTSRNGNDSGSERLRGRGNSLRSPSGERAGEFGGD